MSPPPSPRASPRSREGVSGYVTVLLAVVVVIALPLVASQVSDSADEFNGQHFAFWPAAGWIVCALLTAVVVTRRWQITASVQVGSVLALAYDALPALLVLPWVIAVLSAISDHVLLLTAAAGLCAYHLLLVTPRLFRAPTPHWVKHAPRLRLLVANVFVDNETPQDAARQLVDTECGVAVIVESTAEFMRVLDGEGGDRAYPNRIVDPDGESDYAIAVVTAHELGPRSEFRIVGPLRLAIVELDVGGTSTLLLALNPMATVDPGGLETWKKQIQALAEILPTLSGPVIIAGDLNTTRYRPEFEEIMALGFSDAIDSLGKGLNPSFKLQAGGALGSVGALVRLDHALVNDEVHAVEMRNLDAKGSDHLPFVLELAVRAHGHERHHGGALLRWRDQQPSSTRP